MDCEGAGELVLPTWEGVETGDEAGLDGAGELVLATCEGVETGDEAGTDGAEEDPGTEDAGDEAGTEGAEDPGTDGAGDEAGTVDAEEAGADGAGEVAGTEGTTGTVEFLGGIGADPDGIGNTGVVFGALGLGGVFDATGAVPTGTVAGEVFFSEGLDADIGGEEAELDCCWPGVQSKLMAWTPMLHESWGEFCGSWQVTEVEPPHWELSMVLGAPAVHFLV